MESKMEIPEELKDFLIITDCTNFAEDRYVLTPDMKKIAQDIVKANKVAKEMDKLNLDYLNATLLYGPPGTGKTKFGKYLAYKLHLDFAFLNLADLTDSAMLTKIFRFMKDKKCIFMLDEVDCVAKRRGSDVEDTGGNLSRMTITMMQQLDLYKENRVDCILLAATNHIESIDTAFQSRFAIKRAMIPWTNDLKETYINKFLTSLGIDLPKEEIHEYVVKNSRCQQREIEADMTRCVVAWIENGKKDYKLEHVRLRN